MENLKVCIVGGGHAAQTLMALLPSRGIHTNVYAGFEDEAERINRALGPDGTITADFAPHNEPQGVVKLGRPAKVSQPQSAIHARLA